MLASRRGLKVDRQPAAPTGRADGLMDRPRYTIGVDFGTESARAVLVDVADGREVGVEVYAVSQRRDRRPAAGARRGRRPRPRLGAPGSRRLPRDVPRRRPAARRRAGHRPRPGHRDRHRLHGVHDAPDDGRRHAAVLPRRLPARPARLGQALEAPRRAARGGRHQPRRRASSASRGSSATAARSRPSGSSRRRSRSCARHPRSTRRPTA